MLRHIPIPQAPTVIFQKYDMTHYAITHRALHVRLDIENIRSGSRSADRQPGNSINWGLLWPIAHLQSNDQMCDPPHFEVMLYSQPTAILE